MKQSIFLLPGLDGTGKLLRPLKALLESYCDVTIIQYAESGSFEQMVEEVEVQIPLGKSVSLVAESFSGPIAMEVLARRGRNIGPSVLCATFATAPLAYVAGWAKFLPASVFQANRLNKVMLNIFCLNSVADRELRDEAFAVLDEVEPRFLQQRLEILSRVDLTSRLDDVSVAMLYLRAVSDRLVSRERSGVVVDGLPNVELVELAGPHFLLQSAPELAVDAVVNHLSLSRS